MYELKPCPRCGGEAVIKDDILLDNTGWGKSYLVTWVECESCGTRSKGFNDIDNFSDHTQRAIEDWNNITYYDRQMKG